MDQSAGQQPSSDQSLREAARLDSLGQCDAAEIIYNRLLAHLQPSLALLNNAGNHYLACGEMAKARTFFHRVLTKNPAHPNANLQMARLELAAGNAQDALNRVSKLEDRTPVVSLVRGEASYLVGMREDALGLLAKAEQAAGEDPSLLYALALVYERIEVFDRAESMFTRLLVKRPDDANLLFRLGRSAVRAHHLDRAVRALETAAKLAPGDVSVLLELGRAYAASENAARSVFVLARARKLAPKRPDVLLELARAAEAAGYFGDSALAYDEYLQVRPGDDTARRDRALVYGLTQTRLPQALRDLEAYLGKHPTDAVGWFHLARLTWSTDPQRALEYLDKAIRSDANSFATRFARAWLLYRLGRVADSLPDLQAALKAHPDNAQVLARLGLTYLALDRFADAEKVLRRALGKAPEEPEVLLHLGRALVALDRAEEAEQHLAKFQKLRPQMVRSPRFEAGMIELATTSEAERSRKEIDRLQADSQAHPDDLELQLHLATLLLNAGRVNAARTQFQEIAARNPEARIAHRAGVTLLNTQQYDLARAFLAQAADVLSQARLDFALSTWFTEGPSAALEVLNRFPQTESSGEHLLLKARILDADGKTEEATRVLQSGLNATASNTRVACQAASMLVERDRPERSLALLTDDDASTIALRAGILALLNRMPEAESAMQSVEQRWPEFHRAYLMHSYILARAGRSSEARKKARMAVALGTPRAEAACVLQDGDVASAVCDLRAFVSRKWCESPLR